jgi:hypothetical protein
MTVRYGFADWPISQGIYPLFALPPLLTGAEARTIRAGDDSHDASLQKVRTREDTRTPAGGGVNARAIQTRTSHVGTV